MSEEYPEYVAFYEDGCWSDNVDLRAHSICATCTQLNANNDHIAEEHVCYGVHRIIPVVLLEVMAYSAKGKEKSENEKGGESGHSSDDEVDETQAALKLKKKKGEGSTNDTNRRRLASTTLGETKGGRNSKNTKCQGCGGIFCRKTLRHGGHGGGPFSDLCMMHLNKKSKAAAPFKSYSAATYNKEGGYDLLSQNDVSDLTAGVPYAQAAMLHNQNDSSNYDGFALYDDTGAESGDELFSASASTIHGVNAEDVEDYHYTEGSYRVVAKVGSSA